MRLYPRLLYRRLLHAFDRHGLSGLFRRDPYPKSRFPAEPVHPFDLAHRTETGGCVAGELLAEGSASALYSTAYYGISPSTLTQALDHLGLLIGPEGWTSFTFVDLGCGKGRALLTASGFPFGRIVGVELSPALARIARDNIQCFEAPWQRSRALEIVETDAAAFDFPPAPLVVFLYHPFLAPVLRRVLGQLERSVSDDPREIYLLYANPSYAKVVAGFPFLTHVWDYSLPLSPEDAAADRHGIAHERYTLYRHLP